MVLRSAPDPRDMLWQNATVEHKYIKWKKLQMNALLFTGTLFWSFAVFPITVISDLDRVKKFLPSWLVPEEETFWYNLVEGYIPVIMLELLMLVVPWILRIIATKYIRFKTHSETVSIHAYHLKQINWSREFMRDESETLWIDHSSHLLHVSKLLGSVYLQMAFRLSCCKLDYYRSETPGNENIRFDHD